MDRFQKLELLQRSLGLKHKLKVHESLKTPDNHEDLSLMLLTKWELEDELQAIEEMLSDSRRAAVTSKRLAYEKIARRFEREAKKELTQ
ncbi:MAG: hypothetical protein ABIQ95_07080 [Bdellovibrionia bacterium]